MISEFVSLFNNIEFVYSTITAILSVGLIISSLEELAAFPIYRNTGLLSWKISKYRSPFFLKSYLSPSINFLLSDSQFHAILYLKLILSAILLVTSFFKIFSVFLILIIFFLMLLIAMRNFFGLDGAYQMSLVVLFALSIANLSGIYSTLSSICLWFIAGELILSYFIAGLNKIISPIWRNSHALAAIFSTRTYGCESVFKFVMKYKTIACVLCWPVFIFELIFALAIFSKSLCLFLCIIGFSFHLFNAIFMYAFTGVGGYE
jgi:hypothetical protein